MSRKHPPSPADLHRAWLELVDADGPFLAVPTLERVYRQGIPQPDARALDAIRDAKPAFERAWENWDENRDDPAALDLYREARDTWVRADSKSWSSQECAGRGGVTIRWEAVTNATKLRLTG